MNLKHLQHSPLVKEIIHSKPDALQYLSEKSDEDKIKLLKTTIYDFEVVFV